MKSEQQVATTFDELLAQIREYNPSCDEERIRQAYELADRLHKDQLRDSGEPYIMHPMAVASILASLHMDDTTIMAGLMHDVVEDTEMTLDDIRELYGPEMVLLLDGVTKLSKLAFRSKQERQVENLRKMFLAMSKDIRIIIIKLADRLHNMRTLASHHSEQNCAKRKSLWKLRRSLLLWRTVWAFIKLNGSLRTYACVIWSRTLIEIWWSRLRCDEMSANSYLIRLAKPFRSIYRRQILRLRLVGGQKTFTQYIEKCSVRTKT